MTSTFGSSTRIGVECPLAKGIEGVINQLPGTGILMNLAFSGVIAAVVLYFYIRTRQLKKEIRLIRHNINVGTI
jgi:hypothetical protein